MTTDAQPAWQIPYAAGPAMADETRLTVMKVVERRMLFILEEMLGFPLALRSMKLLWLVLNQKEECLGDEVGE